MSRGEIGEKKKKVTETEIQNNYGGVCTDNENNRALHEGSRACDHRYKDGVSRL